VVKKSDVARAFFEKIEGLYQKIRAHLKKDTFARFLSEAKK
jgi:hypothetical protein